MGQCTRCQSPRLAEVSAKCNDRCHIEIANQESNKEVSSDMGIGGGDYLKITYCLNCGQLQGKFPLAICALEEKAQEQALCVSCKVRYEVEDYPCEEHGGP